VVRLRLPDPANRDMKYLASQEQLVSMVRLHWAVLLRVIGETVGAIALALAVNVFLAVRGASTSIVTTLLWYFALIMILRALWKITDWHMDHLMITDKRLLKVLKGLAEDLEITLAEVIELCVLTSFEQPSGFSKGTQRRIRQLCDVYGVEHGLEHFRTRLFSDQR